MSSSGAQNPNWQRWSPKTLTIARILAGAGDPKFVTVEMPVPDSRLRAKMSLLFIPDDGFETTVPLASLWVYEADIDQSGRLGFLVPLTDIVGESATPLSIPETTALLGYSREFISSADYILARLQLFSNGAQGYWVAQFRYQPDAVRFSPEEWDLIVPHCNPTCAKVLVGTADT